ncbi:MAG: transcription-repair coupling factor, partial [Nitrospirae bacterium]
APGLYLTVGELSRSFGIGEAGPVFLSEADLAGRRQAARVRRPTSPDEVLRDLRSVKAGDFVVHLQHGIGRYRGLVSLTAAGITQEFLELEYAGGDRLYVPVVELDQVSRYIGEEGRPPALSRLGSSAWARAKAQTRKGVELVARELVELYAAREAAEGFRFSDPDDPELLAFEAAFPYEETPDQAQAIREVLADMASPKVMDRLVCGDVGFGKTEVAMRAAARAVLDGKQVVLLAPTTLLAEQHHQAFTARFANLPVRIGHLSRLLTPKEQRRVVEETADGRIDILIGTHRLLSRDLRFHDLGLIIVDEEQRFGVRQKERLKALKTRADCLTLTATPIPRTLQMAMSGLRDISVITTPPEDRLPVVTRVIRRDAGVLRDAIARELARGGQVYWVHNRVQSIRKAAEQVARLAPGARIAIAHGQMEKHELSRVMAAFRDHEHDVLVTTTIIESGLDLPRVNTIVVERADTFGLAQLYQLRGRVGRSSHQAYCYLVTPHEAGMTEEARERLAALAEHTKLGSGFQIAAHDLEIRGSGNLLGAQQAGKIAAVGYDLYVRLVEEAVARLQGREVEELFAPKITLDCSAYLPADYVANPHERLHWYQHLAGLQGREAVEEAYAELVDRYGRPPEPVRALFLAAEIRIVAQRLRAEEVKLAPDGLVVLFSARSRMDPERVLALRGRHPQRVSLRGEYGLHLAAREGRTGVAERVHDALALLEELLAEPVPA